MPGLFDPQGAAAPGAPVPSAPPAPMPGTPPAGAPPQPGAPPPPKAPAQPPPMQTGDDTAKRFLALALKLIYAPQMMHQIIATVGKAPDPVQALAEVTVLAVSRVQASAESSGAPVDPKIIFGVGIVLTADIANLIGKAKIHTYTQPEINSAFQKAVILYRQMQMKLGKPDPAQDTVNRITQAKRNGTLAQNFPGLAKTMKKQGGGAQPQGGAASPSTPTQAPAAGAAPDGDDDDTVSPSAAPAPAAPQAPAPVNAQPQFKTGRSRRRGR